jgi:hypothetical protein
MTEQIKEYNLRRKVVEQVLTSVDIEMQKLAHILNANQQVQMSDLQQMFNNIQNYAHHEIIPS